MPKISLPIQYFLLNMNIFYFTKKTNQNKSLIFLILLISTTKFNLILQLNYST